MKWILRLLYRTCGTCSGQGAIYKNGKWDRECDTCFGLGTVDD
jgi:DnaJ-class molecular chaperone